MIDRLGTLYPCTWLQPADQILLEQREQHDARRLLDFIKHASELFLGAHQRKTCSTAVTLAYCAATARATVISVSLVESETR